MASLIGRSALRATRVLQQSGVNSGAPNMAEADQVRKGVLQKGARRDPELYVRSKSLQPDSNTVLTNRVIDSGLHHDRSV